MKARIWCEVVCCHCGCISVASTYYANADTISKIKRETKDWIYSKEYGGNICPVCQRKLNIKE